MQNLLEAKRLKNFLLRRSRKAFELGHTTYFLKIRDMRNCGLQWTKRKTNPNNRINQRRDRR